ncbi:hypothetical protein CF319_g7644 [Tilletia indica]|nr:hypothetical protein CF319_g7644 [Tilletia indica]
MVEEGVSSPRSPSLMPHSVVIDPTPEHFRQSLQSYLSDGSYAAFLATVGKNLEMNDANAANAEALQHIYGRRVPGEIFELRWHRIFAFQVDNGIGRKYRRVWML